MTSSDETGIPRTAVRWCAPIWIGAACLLLLPWVAMQFTDEVRWSPGDFLVFAAMLITVCGAYELATRMSASTAYRAAAGVALATAFLIVWVNLAVGIVGTEHNPANLMYAGVLLIGILGTAIARAKARGMVRAMAATAVAQAGVAIVALILGSFEGFVLTLVLVAAWLSSAALFGWADSHQANAQHAFRSTRTQPGDE